MHFSDSTLSYFINQLDNFDQRLYEPLYSVSWARDIKLRSDVSMANESTSFTRSTYGALGTQGATGKPWIAQNSNTLPGVSVDGERIVSPLRLLGREISYTSVELERSMLTGQPLDTQKFDALNNMQQMSTDEMVYVGDTDNGAEGLINSTLVTSSTVALNAGATSTLWINKTADEIILDINSLLEATWLATGYAVCPDKLLVPPAQYALIASQKVSDAGNLSILQYCEQNSISLKVNGRPLDIQPLKWATGAGAGSTDRMIAYTNAENRVRFPMVPIRRETPYYHAISYNAPYIWAYGEVEFVYPETIQYADGI